MENIKKSFRDTAYSSVRNSAFDSAFCSISDKVWNYLWSSLGRSDRFIRFTVDKFKI